MPLRLLKYVLRILDRHIETKNDKFLPIVLPVVLHHSDAGWTASTTTQALFGSHAQDAAFSQFVPHFTFALDDLGRLSNEDLKRRHWPTFPTLAAWLLRDARHDDKWLKSLPFWAETLATFRASPQGHDAIVVILSYLYSVNDQLPEHIHNAIVQHVPAIQDIAMTAAEQLIQRGTIKGKAEGKLEGKAEGKLEGEAEALTEILQAKFGAMSPHVRNRIAAADEPALKRWLVRAAIGSSVDFVFAD